MKLKANHLKSDVPQSFLSSAHGVPCTQHQPQTASPTPDAMTCCEHFAASGRSPLRRRCTAKHSDRTLSCAHVLHHRKRQLRQATLFLLRLQKSWEGRRSDHCEHIETYLARRAWVVKQGMHTKPPASPSRKCTTSLLCACKDTPRV